MPGRWKEWKTKSRFPTLPTAPWKSRQPREISTFPQLRRVAPGKVENQTQVSHFPHATRDDDDYTFRKTKVKTRRLRRCENEPQKESIPQHSAVSPLPIPRLTSHWKRNPFSGSLRVGNKYRFQAHFRIGKCWSAEGS